ncbi:ribosome assembly protein 4 (RSA4) [Reticulomyxa filosa]|uniref:Ribosome assembly protein 4 (RSA4) n=1 Tax=Reticulomyxa filosa TaxID=46433 RepID=X6PAP8_RETFI|nr:ribosome assembly protein 4 (RSA4) [Reticulomyxa filosa]|eukprot:ETO35615.1 ribosome assembly protein 4 (RSA4) [Reticulomyxa filosa]
MDAIREKVSFVFIMDGFDEIFDFYRKRDNEQYFYDRFNLNQWNAKVIVTCRSKVLSDEDIKTILIGINQNQTLMTYLWPFTKQQMHNYIEKFAKMQSKNEKKSDYNNDWTPKKYEETLNNYSNLQKMVEEPFLLQLILTVLPSLVKQYGAGNKILKVQVYEVFNEQWIDIHSQNIISKLSELRIQMNINKIKSTFKRYCLDLGFDMFYQGNQVAIESEFQYQNDDGIIWSKSDPELENENKDDIVEEKIGTKTIHEIRNNSQDIWEKYFNGDSIAKYVLRRVGDNKYQFLHRSCQEYYAAQKIILDIVSWKPNIVTTENQQFQQQFEIHVPKLFINYKLLNEELGIIQFIAERIHDNNPIFVNLKSRLFRIIESSKNNENVSIAAANAVTILNSANINMNYQNWNNVKIPYAILDRAFLEGTKFKNANLDHVRFHQACLNKVNFTNASMNNVYFGEYANLEGHTDSVSGIQFSPDGTKIISHSYDNTIRIWDTLSRKQLYVLEGHTNTILAVQFLLDGSKIISYSYDAICIWDVLSGEQIKFLKGNKLVTAACSLDGSKVAIYSFERTIKILSVSSGEQLQLSEHSDYVSTMQFSPDASKIVTGSEDKNIRIWDVFSGKQILLLEGHSAGVTGVSFISNGSKVISYSEDTTLRIWDILSGQQIYVLEGHTGEDSTLRLWDLFSGKQIQVFEGHSRGIIKARFSSDSFRIVSVSFDNTIRLWDISSGKQIQVLEGHSNHITGVEFFPKELKILSCLDNGTIRIWDVAVERKIQLIDGYIDIITGVQFSPDNLKIVSCSTDKTIRLWDIQLRRQIQVFEGHLDCIRGILFLPDGSKIVSYSEDNTIRIWDVLSGKQLQLLEGHSHLISEVQFSPDGSKLVSSSFDKTIRIWDISSGTQNQLLIGHIEGVIGVQFSSDGSKIVSSSTDRTIRLWDVLSGKQLQVFQGHFNFVMQTLQVLDISSGSQLFLLEGHEKDVNNVQFSPDGTQIITCSDDKTIRLWNSLTGKQIHTFEGHANEVIRIQFSSDGSKIISYSKDNTIRIWDVSSRKQLQIFEGHNESIRNIHLSSDGSKLVSCSMDKTIRLWGCDNSKIVDVTEMSLVKCIWRLGIQSGLAMKDSIWKDTKDLEDQQKLLVKQHGGIF